MTPEARNMKAKQLVNDEIVVMVKEELLGRINKELLTATTQEDRESKWHEYHGFKRAWNLLAKWAAEAETK